MLVGFEPTPEDWCLKPAPLVTRLTGSRPLGHNIRRRTPPRETDTGVEPVAFRFQVRLIDNSDGTRTRNPQIRSLIRYPLRHGVKCVLVEEQGFEPWTFRMQSGRSATELHPRAIPTGLEPATPRFEV